MNKTARGGVVVLGSTGAIGRSTLAVVRRSRERTVVGLACGSNLASLKRQIVEFSPRYVWFGGDCRALRAAFPGVRFLSGAQGLIDIATADGADTVVAAIPGISSLPAVLAALESGRTVGLATKEVLVVAGHLVMKTARRSGAIILPVDSEHNAIFQLLRHEGTAHVSRIILTASGGPFFGRKSLSGVTVRQALVHPVWKMGRKITVDSATLMNKAFEMIEAQHLFDLSPRQIDVLIHREAVVHGIVEFADGNLLALLSKPDMRFALSNVLSYPERAPAHWGRLDLAAVETLSFEKPPAGAGWLKLARLAMGQAGTTLPVVLNAANEAAVERFLAGRLPFERIVRVVEQVTAHHTPRPCRDLRTVMEADEEARRETEKLL